ncbi:MAG TPA: HAD-IC family P-type ATPase [Phnomibacter sp.]|nr:HAD-IC family P-type ATPase [Phnomibacter sp.]
MSQHPWYRHGADEVLKELHARPEGLHDDEVKKRQQRYGPNTMPMARPKTLFGIFISQFVNPLIYVLIAAAAVSLAFGKINDALFIGFVVLLNAAIGTWQENKAEGSAAALRNMVKVKARVRRGGRVHKVNSEDLTIGDIVLLESGNRVPADMRLIEVNELIVEEALLTGESLPIHKTTEPIAGDHPSIGDRTNMAFAATTVIKGRATGVVTDIATGTEMGKIAGSLAESQGEKPPLIKRMDVFSRNIAVIVVFVCALLGFIGFQRGMDAFDIFMFMVAVGVSAIPEGLPISLTVALSVGTSRMAKRHVIVRKLAAVEGLGSCTLIASDKTGTLTLDEQSLQRIVLPDGHIYKVTGQGYNGEGEVLDEDGNKVSEPDNELLRYMQAAIMANEGILRRTDNGWEHSGDAVDVAFRAVAYKLGKKPADLAEGCEVEQMVPYESEKKYSGVFYRHNGKLIFAMKGAVEVILEYVDESDRALAFEKSEQLAAEGYRMLALAGGVVPDTDMAHIQKLRLLGLAGLIDPLRPEVIPAIEECDEAGVQVKMVTGDHPATALAIARQLGIAENDADVITGVELEKLTNETPDEIPLLLEEKAVFARVSPLQKRQIIDASKEAGHFVAVTGDGANDAPALKNAHIGIAMGSGTDLTKETASIIVTDDNFASIAAGVEEGRFTYDNLRKIIYLLLSTGLAEITVVALTLIAGLPLPFVAAQLLWLNIVTNGIQDKALAFEKGDPLAMKRPPRRPNEPIFDKPMIRQLFLSAAVMAGAAIGLWYYLMQQAGIQGLEGEAYDKYILHARTQVMMLMVLLQNFHTINCRSETRSLFTIPFGSNWFLWIGILLAQGIHIAASYTPGLSTVLYIEPITLKEWGVLLAMASSILVVMEVYKLLLNKRVVARKRRLKTKKDT